MRHWPALSGVLAGMAVCGAVSVSPVARAQTVSIDPSELAVNQAANLPTDQAQIDSATKPKPPIEGRIVTRVVKDVKSVSGLYHKAANQTPSGFPVPRYVALKKGKVYGRTGPSRNHAIAWEYQRRGLPLVVVAETELWRKVRDYRGDESWIHKSMLTGESHVFVIREAPLRKKAREASEVVAVASAETILKLDRCEDMFCKVKSRDGHDGWIRRSTIWGTESFR